LLARKETLLTEAVVKRKVTSRTIPSVTLRLRQVAPVL